MRASRQCFLAHFMICLALCAGLFFATMRGVPQMVFASDISMLTSAIAALFIGSALYLGWLCWRLSPATVSTIEKQAEFGWLAGETCVRLAIVGTAIGLIAQAKLLLGGTAGLLPLSTSLLCTATGISASIALNVLTFNLISGCDRTRG